MPFAVHRERGGLPAPGAVHCLHRLWHRRGGHALCSVLLQNKVRACLCCAWGLAAVLSTALELFSFSPRFEVALISGQATAVPRGYTKSPQKVNRSNTCSSFYFLISGKNRLCHFQFFFFFLTVIILCLLLSVQ